MTRARPRSAGPTRAQRAECPYAPSWAFDPEPSSPSPRSHSRPGSRSKGTDHRQRGGHRARFAEPERDENVFGLLRDEDEEIAAGRLVWDTEPLPGGSPKQFRAPASPPRRGGDGNYGGGGGGRRPASAPGAQQRRGQGSDDEGAAYDAGQPVQRLVRGGELKHLKKTTFFGRPADEVQPNPEEFLQKGTGRGSKGKPAPSVRARGQNSRTIMKEAVPPNVPRVRPQSAVRDHVRGHIEGDWEPVAHQKLAHRSRVDRAHRLKSKPGTIPKWLSKRKAEVAQQRQEEAALAAEARERAAGRYQRAQPKAMPEEERTQLLAGLRAKRSELEQDYQRHTHLLVQNTTSRQRALKEQLEKEMDGLDAMIAKLSKGAVFIRVDE
eukprot:CAMPEP_0182534474 /NCGR_PEP_ID=MMETSP1323-20130603/15844_1 /TAXON_ID=236787 /ORGANISM="Florenciella parvula, Strain RCC1693" /LENGTH=379 /DNA_ID=CAMNT_0024744493 /DNA_START=20 /DNA_END=1159 /DNA_ORIENTATION=-